jgi:hypothetical protein
MALKLVPTRALSFIEPPSRHILLYRALAALATDCRESILKPAWYPEVYHHFKNSLPKRSRCNCGLSSIPSNSKRALSIRRPVSTKHSAVRRNGFGCAGDRRGAFAVEGNAQASYGTRAIKGLEDPARRLTLQEGFRDPKTSST